jgi:hypothetical protein
MGRKPKPTALKRMMGNPGRRPLPEGEPIVLEPLGPPPKQWGRAEKEIWNEVSDLTPHGVD